MFCSRTTPKSPFDFTCRPSSRSICWPVMWPSWKIRLTSSFRRLSSFLRRKSRRLTPKSRPSNSSFPQFTRWLASGRTTLTPSRRMRSVIRENCLKRICKRRLSTLPRTCSTVQVKSRGKRLWTSCERRLKLVKSAWQSPKICTCS